MNGGGGADAGEYVRGDDGVYHKMGGGGGGTYMRDPGPSSGLGMERQVGPSYGNEYPQPNQPLYERRYDGRPVIVRPRDPPLSQPALVNGDYVSHGQMSPTNVVRTVP